MLKVYGDMLSGNCYKVKLLLEFLQIEHQWLHLDILKGETRSTVFLKKNSNGKIPLLEISEGQYLSESNAILSYLAEDTDFIPEDKLQRARVLQWLFFEQYSHEPFIAVARYISLYLGLPENRLEEYKSKHDGGHKALAQMEAQLKTNNFLVGNSITIADIALYAYSHVADEGGFDLEKYPAIQAWFKRIENQAGYIKMAR
ncbi:glutathione S-transferase family protein [Agaribacterium sp. ZY112]|uniref:glutathione S-transferase family protein n=1 Tax=Agaribacterium sp. ZY112 TaxID=3233574 RepID=UPI0035232D93